MAKRHTKQATPGTPNSYAGVGNGLSRFTRLSHHEQIARTVGLDVGEVCWLSMGAIVHILEAKDPVRKFVQYARATHRPELALVVSL